MSDCNPVQAPMETRLKLSKKSTSPAVDSTLYRSLVGSLWYLIHTRPDISFAVGYISRFMENPTTEHMGAVKHVLRYIAGTLHFGCCYRKGDGNFRLTVYNDADLVGDQFNRKSTLGGAFFLEQSPVAWHSIKQPVVALFSCEAEYIAATSAACQLIWLGQLLGSLYGKAAMAAKLLIDNQSTIQLCKNPVFHGRSKHIETRFDFIRESVENGKVAVRHVNTDDQLADIMTKPLGRVRFQQLRLKIGIVNIKEHLA